MASQWNEEFISQFTPGVRDGQTLRTADDGSGRHLFIPAPATEGESVHMNLNDHQQMEMPELDLFSRNDLVGKVSEIVSEADTQQHAQHSSSHNSFDTGSLCLVTSDASILINPEQANLEASHFVNASNRQLPELPPNFLQSLRSALAAPVSQQGYRHQHPTHRATLLHMNDDQPHQHLHEHLEPRQEEQSPPDLLLPQAVRFESSSESNHHPLSEQNIRHAHSPTLHLSQEPTCRPHAGSIAQQVAAQSQSQLSNDHDVHPLSTLQLGDNILSVLPLSSKLASLVSDQQTSRPGECNGVPFSSSDLSMPFLAPNVPPLQIMNTAEMVRLKSDSITPVRVNVLSSPYHAVNDFTTVSISSSGGKAKKRKLAGTANGDMVWMNNKSLESRQRDRLATQVLIEIVRQSIWQEKLQSSTTKKKTVWKEIGEEFTSRGYFLENPGKKCFQKWRNLERSFRDYEMNKRSQSSVPKCLPDFYEELHPVLKEKLSLDAFFEEEGEKTGVIDERLMEKYVDFDPSSSREDRADNAAPSDSAASDQSSDNADADVLQSSNTAAGLCPTDYLEKLQGASSSAKRKLVKTRKKMTGSMKRKPRKTPGYQVLMSSISHGLKSQQKDMAQMNSTLQSIKELMVEQIREREASNAESKLRLLELKAIIDKNQKEKMAFMFEFLKSFSNNQNHHTAENS